MSLYTSFVVEKKRLVFFMLRSFCIIFSRKVVIGNEFSKRSTKVSMLLQRCPLCRFHSQNFRVKTTLYTVHGDLTIQNCSNPKAYKHIEEQ